MNCILLLLLISVITCAKNCQGLPFMANEEGNECIISTVGIVVSSKRTTCVNNGTHDVFTRKMWMENDCDVGDPYNTLVSAGWECLSDNGASSSKTCSFNPTSDLQEIQLYQSIEECQSKTNKMMSEYRSISQCCDFTHSNNWKSYYCETPQKLVYEHFTDENCEPGTGNVIDTFEMETCKEYFLYNESTSFFYYLPGKCGEEEGRGVMLSISFSVVILLTFFVLFF